MHTYVDFITHVKGVEYILSVLAIAGFICFLEILKPRPFRTLIRSTREDVDHMRSIGYGGTSRTVKRMLAGPFIGLFYVIMFPFLFVYALGTELSRMVLETFERILGMAGRTAFFGWRPTEAYLGGKKGGKERRKGESDGKEKEKEAGNEDR